ncbi:MAG: ATP synthase F1 subunit gamma [Deltaproteobacteria bacterium]|nr:ATP synthase F1 subunit gamma [Deltaproteobacteria bacterium]
MATLREIQRRIKSVKNTQQITKAMKMVSAAKLRRAQENIVAARPYADKVKDLVAALEEGTMPENHKLLSKGSDKPAKKAELILLTSDRGLCGGFNSYLIRMVERFMREHPELDCTVSIVGRRALDHFKGRSEVTGRRHFGSGRPDFNLAEEIAGDAVASYLEDSSDEVYLVYSTFQSALTQTPVIQKLLPIIPDNSEKEALDSFLFEPSPEAVLDVLLPKYVEVQVFRALLESSASEHGARMTAMDSASKNASEMIGGLTLIYNRARQAAITKELLEIISGAEALKDN